jgi:Predicted hydrolases or acyltransferases (alpha/beta hydrolase superfamily)
MKNTRPYAAAGATVALLLLIGQAQVASRSEVRAGQSSTSNPPGDDLARDDAARAILTIDHWVPHISTAHANGGEHVELFVRERVRRGGPRQKPVVLMIHGATVPAVPQYDLRFEDYSWMAFLAQAGFDVFALDLQGYGLSPRPRMDDPCNTQGTQQALLIPNPLAGPCPATYGFKMAMQSDWDEIDEIVEYLKDLRGVEKVSLIGHSRGGPRAGGYAANHPENVDKLFLYAPAMYTRQGPSDPPPLPETGSLMQLGTVQNLTNNWNSQVHCENQFVPAIRPAIWASILAFDPVGSTWGDGQLWRAPVQNTLWGWNQGSAAHIEAPTLIIRGEFDTQAPLPLQRDLFDDLGTNRKVFVRVACSGHQLVWENQHTVLFDASRQWLRHGRFAGNPSGSFFVDTKGNVFPE